MINKQNLRFQYFKIMYPNKDAQAFVYFVTQELL